MRDTEVHAETHLQQSALMGLHANRPARFSLSSPLIHCSRQGALSPVVDEFWGVGRLVVRALKDRNGTKDTWGGEGAIHNRDNGVTDSSCAEKIRTVVVGFPGICGCSVLDKPIKAIVAVRVLQLVGERPNGINDVSHDANNGKRNRNVVQAYDTAHERTASRHKDLSNVDTGVSPEHDADAYEVKHEIECQPSQVDLHVYLVPVEESRDTAGNEGQSRKRKSAIEGLRRERG